MAAERTLIDSVWPDYGDTLAVICYHIGSTYQNPPAEEREAFYNTGLSPPYVIFDGTLLSAEPQTSNYDSSYRANIDIARTRVPYFNLDIDSASASQSTGAFDLMIVAADTIPEDEINAFVVILEDSLDGSYTTFMKVCRSLYEFPLTLAYPDTLDTTITFSHSIEPSKMTVVVFVQDMDTKEVMQSTMSYFEEE